MMRRTAVLMMAALLATAGCQTLGRAVFSEPVVDFRDLRVRGLGVTGGTIDVELSIYNPNNFALDAKRFTYRLMMDSTQIADGELADLFSVRSGDSTIVTIPVRFTYAGLGHAGTQLINSGSVDYRVAGDVTVGTPLGDFTRPYSQRGTFNALDGGRSR
ncbi:MAG TPA: LEA type 2 family protein [Gemmatimonadales bacterium]|nr:LEA type 2 family protein [Gemmatimonadales bacterium]